MEFNEIVQLLTKISDAIHPTQQNQLLTTRPVSETDGVLLSSLSIISPALCVLRTQLDGLELDSRAEDVHSMIYNTDEVPQADREKLVASRVDNCVYARKRGKKGMEGRCFNGL